MQRLYSEEPYANDSLRDEERRGLGVYFAAVGDRKRTQLIGEIVGFANLLTDEFSTLDGTRQIPAFAADRLRSEFVSWI